MANRSVAVFDLGGVLIDWNPRYLYRKLFDGDDAAMEHFLANVCTSDWNTRQDGGRTLDEACALVKAEHPEHARMIDAWRERYEEMLGGPIQGMVDLLAEMRSREFPCSRSATGRQKHSRRRRSALAFWGWFHGTVLSGEVRLLKPDPRIYHLLFETHGVNPADAVYIDDLQRNVDAANALGMHGIRFTDAQSLRKELAQVGLIPAV